MSGPLVIGALVSGRGSNLRSIIRATAEGRVPAHVSVVISNVAAAGALEIARESGIEAVFLDPKSYPGRGAYDTALVEVLRSHGVELVALAGYMRLVGPAFLEAFPNRVLNIHPSLLPAFPGLNAQKKALEHGVKLAGCSVFFVDEGTDTGPIIIQAAVPVHEDDTVETLSDRILAEEHRIYPAAVRLLAEGRLRIEGRRVRVLPASAAEGAE